MSAVGGSVQDVTIRGRLFSVAADADVTIRSGGYTNEAQANGDGTARLVKTRTTWALEGVVVAIDHDRGDLEFLQEIANSKDFHAISITLASNVTYQGRGTVTGDLGAGTQNATATVSLTGPGELTQQ